MDIATEGRVVHTGQVVIDLTMQVERIPSPGTEVFANSFSLEVGGGFNVLRAARRMGVTAEYVGGIGSGPLAEVARGTLIREGVIVTGYRDTTLDTGFCVALTDADAERTFLSTRGAELATPLTAYDHVRVGRADVVYMTGYSLADPEPRDALLRLVSRLVDRARPGTASTPGAPCVVFDPSTIVEQTDPDALRQLATLHPVWTMNLREAAVLAGVFGLDARAGGSGSDDTTSGASTPGGGDHAGAAPTSTVPGVGVPAGSVPDGAALAGVLSQGLDACVVVRAGARGAWLAQDGQVELIPAPTVHAVDTNGAGDTHAGVLCAALAVGRTMRDAVRLANVAAAISVTREGPATSPTVDELGEALTGSAGV